MKTRPFYVIEPHLPTVSNMFSCEPSLSVIIRHYYISHGILPKTAERHTDAYIKAWVKAENEQEYIK